MEVSWQVEGGMCLWRCLDGLPYVFVAAPATTVALAKPNGGRSREAAATPAAEAVGPASV